MSVIPRQGIVPTYGFVDGAYLRRLARENEIALPNPANVIAHVHGQAGKFLGATLITSRIIYYDAAPDDDSEVPDDLRDYWDALELQPDTELGFGSLRGKAKRTPRRQKGVDTLIAVDMLVGAFTDLFPVATLIAGDADFVPVVREVRRRGVLVIVGAAMTQPQASLSDELRRAADRVVDIGSALTAFKYQGRTWPTVFPPDAK